MGSLVNGIVAKQEAAERELAAEEERKKAEIRARLEAVEPRRKSARATAAQTRIKLATQAQSSSPASGSKGDDRRGPASDSESESAASDGDEDGKEEELEYDPVADLARNGSDHESGEDEDELASEDSGRETDISDRQAAGKRGRDTLSRKPFRLKRDKKPAGRLPAETSLLNYDDEDDDADLQTALALSLMESDVVQTMPCTAGTVSAPSTRNEEACQEDKSPSANSSGSPAVPSGSHSQKAKARNKPVGQCQQLGKSKKHRKGSALEASPQSLKKAFSMIATRKIRITQEDLIAVRSLL